MTEEIKKETPVVETPPVETPSVKETSPAPTPPEGEKPPVETPPATDPPKEDINYAEELNKLESEVIPSKQKPARSEEDKAKFTLDKIHERFPHLKGEVVAADATADGIDEVKDLMLRNQAEGIIRQTAKSEDEVKYKMHFYDNRIQRTGNIHTDVEAAVWLANKGRTQNAIKEMKRDPGDPGSASGPGQKLPSNTAPQLPAEEHKILINSGFKLVEPGRYESSMFILQWDKGVQKWDQTRK